MKSLAWSIEKVAAKPNDRFWLFYSEYIIFYKILKIARNDIDH